MADSPSSPGPPDDSAPRERTALIPPPVDAAYPRVSQRWETARRAVRDGDLTTLQWLMENAAIFENAPALREACFSGAWGSGNDELLQRPYSTTDSIRLHELLMGATTRGHVHIVQHLLARFPAKDMHVLEWEPVVNAIAQASVDMLDAYIRVDPELVHMWDKRYGNCFTALFSLAEGPELHLPVVELLLKNRADPNIPVGSPSRTVLLEAKQYSTTEVVALLREYGAV